MGCFESEALDQGRQQHEGGVIGRGDGEGAGFPGGIEAAPMIHHLFDAFDALPQRLAQFLRQRRQFQIAADPHQQFVIEPLAQPGERSAHRRLTQTDPLSCPGYVALAQQRVECHQKIEIELQKIHWRPPSGPAM